MMPNRDFRDIVFELIRAKARFLIVGAHALSVHGVPRATADLDLWIDASMDALGIEPVDLTQADIVAQFGLPPYRIDVLTGVSGLKFEEAWGDRIEESFEDLRAPFIGRAAFVRNKRASGRTRDLADLEALGEV